MSARGAVVPEKEGSMDYAVSRRGVSSCEMLECARILEELDGERLTLASFASETGTFPKDGFCCEMERHRERIFDLTELEELMMIRTRYVDFDRTGGRTAASGRFCEGRPAARTCCSVPPGSASTKGPTTRSSAAGSGTLPPRNPIPTVCTMSTRTGSC